MHTARSVLLRADGREVFAQMVRDFPIPDPTSKELCARYAQYKRNQTYRRAFICERCYSILDNRSGVGTVMVNGKPECFQLAGASRGGAAAVYDQAKWESYQRREATKMGIRFDD